jgi:hypothetical protein
VTGRAATGSLWTFTFWKRAAHFVTDVFATPTKDEGAERYDTDQPWICWRFLSTDARTRITGHSTVLMDCCVCGRREKVRIRISRFGPVPMPPGGRHVERLRFMLAHLHPDRGHPMSWAKPLRNVAAMGGKIDLNLLAMRLEADLNEALNG